MEYVDYYLNNLLTYIDIPVGSEVLPRGGRIVLNNIATINYNEAMAFAKTIVINEKKGKDRLLLLSEEEFIDTVSSERLDAKKLWKLCVLLYTMISKEVVAVTELTVEDEYMKLYTALKMGLNITSITVEGKMNDRGKRYNITNESLMAKMLKVFINFEDGFDGNYHYVIGDSSFTTINTIVDKRVVSYRFALEVEMFIRNYLDIQKEIELSPKYKMLILQILYLFGQFKNNPPSNTDNYRQLMSYGKKLQLNNSITLINGEVMPFTIVMNPESIKIRDEFSQLIGKCEI